MFSLNFNGKMVNSDVRVLPIEGELEGVSLCDKRKCAADKQQRTEQGGGSRRVFCHVLMRDPSLRSG